MKKMMSLALISASLFVTACSSESADQAAMRQYVDEMKAIASHIIDVSSKVETLAEGTDLAALTPAQKDELKVWQADIAATKAQAEAVTVPAPLAGVHPELVAAISGMQSMLKILSDVSTSPDSATPEMVSQIDQISADAEKSLDVYLKTVEGELTQHYPELLDTETDTAVEESE
jgi:hypothetical protein